MFLAKISLYDFQFTTTVHKKKLAPQYSGAKRSGLYIVKKCLYSSIPYSVSLQLVVTGWLLVILQCWVCLVCFLVLVQ